MFFTLKIYILIRYGQNSGVEEFSISVVEAEAEFFNFSRLSLAHRYLIVTNVILIFYNINQHSFVII